MTGKYYVTETIRQHGIADRWNGSRSNFSPFEAPCNRTGSLSPSLSSGTFPGLQSSNPDSGSTGASHKYLATPAKILACRSAARRVRRRKARPECALRESNRRLSSIPRNLIRDSVYAACRFIYWKGTLNEILLPFVKNKTSDLIILI